MAAQNSAPIEITFDTRKSGFRLAGFIQACQNNLQHALGDVAVTLSHGQHWTLQEVEQFVITEGSNRQIGWQLAIAT
jgi:hypothetical protein